MTQKNFLVLFVAMGMMTLFAANPSAMWDRWLAAKKTGHPLPMPNYASCGFGSGDRAIPVAPGKTYNVVDYGAAPDDAVSDKHAIRRAIAAASATGGIVFFPKGRYIAHGPGDDAESIRISNSFIVLKGEGAGPGGTEIAYTEMMPPVNPTSPLQSGAPLFRWQIPEGAPRDEVLSTLAEDTVPGADFFTVKEGGTFKAGDLILLDLKSKAAIRDFMGPYEMESTWDEMKNGGIMLKERHVVLSVSGNRVFVDGGVHLPLKAEWQVAVRRNTAMVGVGVEDIHFVGGWKGDFVHHRSWMDDGGFNALSMERVAESWVRRCRFTDFNASVAIIQGLRVTVMQVSLEGNGGHGSAGIYNSTACLEAFVDCSAPHWHGPGVAKSALANMFHKVTWTDKTSIEMHASQPWGNAWDCCRGGLIYARDGGDKKNLPNHLGKLTYWNFEQVGKALENFSFWRTDSQWGRQVMPILVGWHGAPTTFKADTVGVLESPGQAVEPGSLYEAQLKARLGALPPWLGQAENEWATLKNAWGLAKK